MELLKLLSTSEIVAQILGFLLLFFLLRAFAWKRLLALLDERKARISSEFQKIEETKAALERIKTDYESKMKAIDETTRTKLQEAILEGRKITEQIKKVAQQEAAKILEKAEANIKYELARSRVELKDVIVNLVLETTERVIGERLTPEGDKKIVEEFLKEIDKADQSS